ncbi:ATP-binding protein [Oceanicella actignis]|uniref:histidine kinase n=1 Tax=Oceanicella actignis TaxID=1189325 RepID=A0A1M7T814_9RHOB|nr:HAMP domain-containing sensor histidine kinase [Oceanicella actignis]SET49112.1 Signal transduction histidine kinase [Oceanicella actignis]SHN66870.1 Signal transduction histidine kinase [Oceanicella actignis]
MRADPRSWPITVRVGAAAAGLMILLGLAASQQVLATLGRLQDARLQEIARLHVEGLAVALGPFVLHKDVWEVYDTLDRARGAGRIRFTVVADDEGRVLAATDPLRAPVGSALARFAEGASPLGSVSADGAEEVVRIAAPLEYQGRRVGRIVTELDVSDLAAERRRATLALLAGNGAATALLVLAGYLAVARLLRPVELLARHMGEAGDAPHPIPERMIPRSDNVLARLLRNFNAMTGAIEARAQAERRLAERERFVSLGRLSSSLAHEINNPLGGLLNAADTIRAYADRPEVVRQSAELLDRGLRHLRDVSRAMLDEHRLDRAGRPLSRADFEDLRVLFSPEARRRAQRLEWRVEGDERDLAAFPSAPVRQIALNLLLNAAAAAPQGGVVGLSAEADGAALTLRIGDDGPGLSDAARARLMSEAPLEPGGGVGLRLVRELTRGLGGAIDCARMDGRTVIEIRLPARAEA